MKKFAIRNSKHGKGVFSTQKIAKGEVIYVVGESNKISYSQLLNKKNTDNPIQISPRKYLDWRPPGVHFNHSCSPNVGLTAYPKMRFVALRDIKAGEELRWDYSTSIDADTECEFICDCGAKNCRKVIGGFKWLPKSSQTKYVNSAVVQKYLLHA